jgi:hypothetical protein
VRPTPVKLGHAVEDVVAWTTWVCFSAKGAVIILISSHAEEDVAGLVAERPAARIPGKVVSMSQRCPGPDLRQCWVIK